tara:strand:+ start:2167 stop:3426 length:1260 start_codon:yes stop_codon:yes gene_type:complete
MIKYRQYYIPILFLFFNLAIAQDYKLDIHIQKNPMDNHYWWLENNNFGIQPHDINLQVNWKLKTLKAEYVITTIGEDLSEKIYLNESFIKYNFSDDTFLRLGKYYKDFSIYLNDDISSGSMLISHNAKAMPKVGIVTSKKIKKIVFNAGMAHGMFDKGDVYTEAPLLHEKFIYINIKKDDIHYFSLGFVHEAMWGGATSQEQEWPLKKSSNMWKDFLKVFISADGPYEGGPHANALGNHLGIWDFSYQKKENDQILKLYYQHFFEDTSSLRFANKTDGLWGVELTNYIPDSTLLFEYIDISHAHDNPPYQNDYYYANYQYVSGWTYKNNTLGNILVNYDGSVQGFQRNMKAIHIGAKGEKGIVNYQIKASRKINKKDDILYQVMLGTKMKDNLDLNIFIVNNGINNGLGISLSYFAKNF